MIKYNRQIFKEIDTADKAYWLGFILADGYLNYSKRMLRIKLGQEDGEDHLLKFISFIGGSSDMLKTEIHSSTKKTMYYVSLYGKEVLNSLSRLGIEQAKSGAEKPIPIDKSLERDFIRGVWDGDGFIRKSGSGIGLVGSYELLDYVQKVFQSELGIQPLKIHTHGVIFKIEYRAKGDSFKILSFLYEKSTVYLNRKFNLYTFYCRV